MDNWKLKATADSGGDFDLITSGNHAGVVIAVVDLGTHDVTYKQKDGSIKESKARKLYIAWEIDEAKKGGGGNHIIGREFTWAFGKLAALRELIENWRGNKLADDEEFDVSKILGKTCLVNVTHTAPNAKNRVYHGFGGASKMPPKMPVHQPTYPLILWDMDSGTFDQLAHLPWSYGNKLEDIIKTSDEYRGKSSRPPVNEDADDAPELAGVGAEKTLEEMGF